MIDRRHFIALSTFVTLWMGTAVPATASAIPVFQAETTQPVRAPKGMVVSETMHASKAGADVLAAGGNAVDAAIATGFALAVTHPSAGNIGGGGFMVIRFRTGPRPLSISGRKLRWPLTPRCGSTSRASTPGQKHHNGPLAVGVPGTVAGFWKAHQLYGSQEWEWLLRPAVDLARDGFNLTDRLARGLRRLVSGRGTDYEGTLTYFSNNGRPYSAGDRLTQADLGRTLERIALDGRDGFYAGETARLLVAEMERIGGIITLEDLARYQPRERTPVQGTYRGYDVISMPPPPAGNRAGRDAQHPRGV